MRIEAELPFVTTTTLPQHKPTAQPRDAELTAGRQNQVSMLTFSLKHSIFELPPASTGHPVTPTLFLAQPVQNTQDLRYPRTIKLPDLSAFFIERKKPADLLAR